MLKWLTILLFLAGYIAPEAMAQAKRKSPQRAPRGDSIIRQTVVIDAKTMKMDTFYVRDLPRYTPEDGMLLPADTEKIVILRTERKTVEEAMQQMSGIREGEKGRDEQGAIKYYNLPYRSPRLGLQIKLTQQRVRDVDDLKFFLTVTNNTPYAQEFLFDRPRQEGFVLWGAACRVGSTMHSVLLHESRARYEVRAADRAAFKHMVRLKPYEWLMKQFSVADIAVVNGAVCKNGKLPPGNYTLQFILQGNYSNVITFTVTR